MDSAELSYSESKKSVCGSDLNSQFIGLPEERRVDEGQWMNSEGCDWELGIRRYL
jgi:hypothetical protein